MTTPEIPKGLYQKYYIQKLSELRFKGYDILEQPIYEPVYTEVDPDAEYFVMRVDRNGDDKIHAEACRQAVVFYAHQIKYHLPELSKDLIEKYRDPNILNLFDYIVNEIKRYSDLAEMEQTKRSPNTQEIAATISAYEDILFKLTHPLKP